MSTMTITPSYSFSPSVRLTRRGRLVVLLAALVAVLVLGVVWGGGSSATERPGTPEPTLVVTVQPGETLYGIAATVTTDGDVAAMVERIQSLNALDSGMLAAGQRIKVPVTQ